MVIGSLRKTNHTRLHSVHQWRPRSEALLWIQIENCQGLHMLNDPCQETPLAGERDPRALDAQSFLPPRRACVLRGIVLILMLLITIYIIHCFSIQIFYQTIPSTCGIYSRPLLFCHFQLLGNWHAWTGNFFGGRWQWL